ncbi:transcription termination/antitermination NusG family protein [uncultured Slackia sp.]|uniref:transcription termination/antitermination NusG family protein n=1 Tax=uncultured Slackia sp. TaxID=665903 RepID=UPI0026DD8AEB|nr:transcription termination/antitermination NusG family protein [uncultured Slackia sp.]
MRIYAIQVASGQEAKVEELIRRFVDESMVGEIFVPRFEAMRRWKGEWHKRAERLVRGICS